MKFVVHDVEDEEEEEEEEEEVLPFVSP